MVKYYYDAWGNHIVSGSNTTLGNLNPFRYRGYYFDTETSLYFLQTRYYDPEVGRFISQDSTDYADPTTLHGLNLYAYCNNNPVMNVDPTGKITLSFILMSMLIGGLIGGISSGVKASQDGLGGKGIFLAVLGGAVLGAAISGAFALGGAAITGLTVLGNAVSISGVGLFMIATNGTAVASVVNYLTLSKAYDNEVSIEGMLKSADKGANEGAISFGFGALAGINNRFKYADISYFKDTGYLGRKTSETIIRVLGYNLPSAILRRFIR